jgi:hypothetical protein
MNPNEFNLQREIITKYTRELEYCLMSEKTDDSRLNAIYDICRMFVPSQVMTKIILSVSRKLEATKKLERVQSELDTCLHEQYSELSMQSLQDEWQVIVDNITNHKNTLIDLINEASNEAY